MKENTTTLLKYLLLLPMILIVTACLSTSQIVKQHYDDSLHRHSDAYRSIELSYAAKPECIPVNLDKSNSSVKTSISFKPVIDSGGHNLQVNKMLFSPDGRLLYTISLDTTIQIWDVSCGKRIAVWHGHQLSSDKIVNSIPNSGLFGRLYSAAISNDGKYIAVGGITPSNNKLAHSRAVVRLHNASSGELIKVFDGHKTAVTDIQFSDDGLYLYSIGFDGITKWDIKSGQKIRHYPGAGLYENSIILSYGDSVIITAGEKGDLRFIDTENGSSLYKRKLDTYIRAIAITSDDRYLLAAVGEKVELLDGRTGSRIKTLAQTGCKISSISISPDNSKFLTTCSNIAGPERVYGIPSGELLNTFTGHKTGVTASAFHKSNSPGSELVATADTSQNIILWNPSTSEIIHALETQAVKISNVAFSPDGKAIGFSDSTSLIDNLVRGNFNFDNTIISNVKDSIYPINDYGFIDSEISVFSKNGIDLKKTTPAKENWIRGTNKLHDGYVGIASDDLKSIKVYRNKKLVHTIKQDKNVFTSLAVNNAKTRLFAGTQRGKIIVYDTSNWQHIYSLVGHVENVLDLAVSPDDQWLASAGGNTIKLWSIANTKFYDETNLNFEYTWSLLSYYKKKPELHSITNEQIFEVLKHNASRKPKKLEGFNPVLTIVPFRNGEWIATTASGYYDASKNADNNIGWLVDYGYKDNAEFYSANQFRRFLYRPDLVAETLKLHSESKAKVQSSETDLDVKFLIEKSPPDIHIANVEFLPDEKMKVRIKIGKNSTNPPERITIFVNGAQQLRPAQRKLSMVYPGDELEYILDSYTHLNQIKVSIENRWSENSIESYYNNSKKTTIPSSRPNLHITAIGINKYPNLPPDQQLNSPNLDAANIASTFKKLEGVMYDSVSANVLTNDSNEHITDKDIEKLLTKQAEYSTPKDTNIIFLAGHGISDSRKNYHFITANTRFNVSPSGDFEVKKSTSFSWEKIHKALDQMPGRRIIIVDTCQAGEVISTQGSSIRKLVKDTHDVNAIIYSGTSRQQLGNESNTGGVFTRTILDGIDGKAEYSGNSLRLDSLIKYVNKNVISSNREIAMRGLKRANNEVNQSQRLSMPASADNTQTPVSVIPDNLKNFIIYTKESGN